MSFPESEVNGRGIFEKKKKSCLPKLYAKADGEEWVRKPMNKESCRTRPFRVNRADRRVLKPQVVGDQTARFCVDCKGAHKTPALPLHAECNRKLSYRKNKDSCAAISNRSGTG